MDAKKKYKIGTYCAILVVLVSAACGIFSLTGGGSGFLWFLAIANLCFGPICLIAYLREVRKGVFKDDSKSQ